ncbi:MAG TPA: alpha amylase C-terminal domain-containing protein, partial [bacterium]|nr:alpha amylase C-terminal domain-containing protein [bacterium]
DNRRMMLFGDDLNEHQQDTLAVVKKLAAARAAYPALRRGTRETVHVEEDVWLYTMSDGDDTVLIAFNRGEETVGRTFAVPLVDGSYTDALSEGTTVVKEGSIDLTLPPRSAAIYAKAE